MANTLLPPPYKGQNDQFPLISIQSPYCERMVNFNNLDGVVKVRQGNDLFCSVSLAGVVAKYLENYNSSTPILLQLYLNTGGSVLTWANITSGTASTVHTLALTMAGADIEIQTLYFNNYLMWFGEGTLSTSGTGPQYFNGSAWGTLGYVWPSNFNPFGGNVYKNRAYFINRLTAQYGYSGIDAISGTVTLVDLEGVLSTKANLYIIRTIALTQNLSAEAVQAFIFSTGEVLVYGGSYPDSPNWALVSRFKITPPLRFNSYVDAKGDSFLLTESEILSLRNLYIGGYDKERDEGIGAAIQNRWQQIVTALRSATAPAALINYSQAVKGVYDQVNDRLVIQLPAYVDPTTSAVSPTKPFQLIYDFKLGAWYEYVEDGNDINYTASIAYSNNAVYFLCDRTATTRTVKLEGNTNFLDDDLDGSGTKAIEYDLITAPLPISKFGANAITGVEAIVRSDLYPQTNYKFIADLGRQETAAQNLPDQGSSISKPMMNVGIQGAIAAQLQVYGSTVSVSIGLEISALNVWYNSGESGSR